MKAVAIAKTEKPQTLETPKPKIRPKHLHSLRTGIKPYYESKDVRLYCAYNREVLAELTPGFVDTVITDPPYGITNFEWDRAIDWPHFWGEVNNATRPTSPVVIFASGKFVYHLTNTHRKNYDPFGSAFNNNSETAPSISSMFRDLGFLLTKEIHPPP